MNPARFLDKGQLYVVALPIGNPEDITVRARRVLNSVDVVAVEDTRTFKQWCERWEVKPKRLIAFHEHNESESAQGIIRLLLGNQTIAITSDAGTPGISDPGFRLMKILFDMGVHPVPVPGASSLTAALSICPIGGSTHFFGAFAPSDSVDRVALFTKSKFKAHRLIFFESPHRLLEHLGDALTIFGDVRVALFRELTKEHEEFFFGTVSEAIAHFQNQGARGEFVIVYEGLSEKALSREETEVKVRELLDTGKSAREIREILQSETDLSRRDLYDLIEACKRE